MSALVRSLDLVNATVGRCVKWLAVVLVLVLFGVVVLRYVFGTSFIALQESVIYIHSAIFMLGAGYTLLHGGHVRVDIFYRGASNRFRAWVDIFGVVFLLTPMMLVVLYYSEGFVTRSWLRLEGSGEAGGLPGLFLLKTVIPAFCGLMLLQGFSLLARSVLVLCGDTSYARREDGSEAF